MVCVKTWSAAFASQVRHQEKRSVANLAEGHLSGQTCPSLAGSIGPGRTFFKPCCDNCPTTPKRRTAINPKSTFRPCLQFGQLRERKKHNMLIFSRRVARENLLFQARIESGGADLRLLMGQAAATEFVLLGERESQCLLYAPKPRISKTPLRVPVWGLRAARRRLTGPWWACFSGSWCPDGRLARFCSPEDVVVDPIDFRSTVDVPSL